VHTYNNEDLILKIYIFEYLAAKSIRLAQLSVVGRSLALGDISISTFLW